MKLESVSIKGQYGGVNVEEMADRRHIWLSVGVGVFAFFFYRFVLDHYYLGDPLYYQRFYDAVGRMDLASAIISQRDYLGSSELVYPVVAWLGSNAGIERNTLMAAIGGVMYAILFSTLLRHRCNTAFIVLCMANFYLVVLATSAERLKFSYIFLFLAMMTAGRMRLIWMAMAPLAHFQSLITITSILIWNFFANFTLRVKAALVAVSAFCGIPVLYVFYEPIIEKFIIYREQAGLESLFAIIGLLGLSLVLFENKLRTVFTMLPLIIMTLAVGGSRLNMIAVTVFLYMAIKDQKTGNPAVLLVMCYFAFKSVVFVRDILLYGTGFGY